MRYLNKEIKIIYAAIICVVLTSMIIDTLLDYNLFRENSTLTSNYEKMNQISISYTDSKTAFRLYNRNREEEYLYAYSEYSQKTETILNELAPILNKERNTKLDYRIVLQMLEYRNECVKKFISFESVQGNRVEDLEYIHILNDRIEKQISVLMSHYLNYLNQNTTDNINKYERSQILINGAYLFIVIVLTLLFYLITRNVLKTISGINYVAKELAANNFDVEDIRSTRYCEVNLFIATFNDMKRAIKNLIKDINQLANERVEAEQQRRLLTEAKMKELQMQINPHFLFNTLSLAIRSIQRGEKENCIQLIKSTSKILRSSMDTKSLKITLDDEIELLKSYIYIQQLHLQNRVSFYLDIRKAYSDNEIYVPPLVMQPVVENCVFHGLKDVTGDGIVSIRITEYAGHVEVIIEDNGTGMDHDKIEELFNGMHKQGVGLSNVLERLKMFYKQDDVLQITSILNKGTGVTMKLYK